MSASSGPTPDTGEERVVMDWSPSGVVTTMWVAMGIMLGLLGLLLFGLIFAVLGPTPRDAGLTFDAPMVAILSVAMLVVHQLIHAAAARLSGAAPRFVVDVVQLIFPVFYCSVSGHHFTRTQYLVYLLLPMVSLSLLGVLVMLVDYRGAILIIPLAVNLAMSMRDIWMAWVVARQPSEIRVLPRDDGFRLILVRD